MTTSTAPANDPTAPAINPKVVVAAGIVTAPGLGLTITDYVQHGHIAWPAVLLAVLGLAGGLFHSSDVGKRFGAWLGTEQGRLAAAHPELVAVRADLTKLAADAAPVIEAVDPKLMANLPVWQREAARRIDAVETTAENALAATEAKVGLSEEDVRRIVAAANISSPVFVATPSPADQPAPTGDTPPSAPTDTAVVDPAQQQPTGVPGA